MSTRLQKLINEKGFNLSLSQAESLFKKTKSRNRIIKKSWIILQEELDKENIILSTRDAQDICAKILGHRNRNSLVSIENDKNFPIKLWMHLEGVLKDQFLHFAYLCWYNFEASSQEKKDLPNLTKEFVKLRSEDTLKKGLNSFNLSYLKQFKNYSMPDDVPSYLRNSITGFEFERVFSTTDEIIDYSLFDLNLNKLDFQKIGNYYISLPKKTSHAVIGGFLAHNCMSACAHKEYDKIKANPQRFNEEGNHYLDAHIIDDKTNQIVGVMALEEIFKLRATGKMKRSLFVNSRNGMNKEMEEKLHKLVYSLFKIKGEMPKIDNEQEVKPLKRKGACYPLPTKLKEEFNKYFS